MPFRPSQDKSEKRQKKKKKKKHDMILHKNGVSKDRILLFSGKMSKAGSTIRDFVTIRHEKNAAASSCKGDGDNKKEKGRRHSIPEAWWRRK